MGRFIQSCRRVILFNTVATYGNGHRQTAMPGFYECRQPGELREFLACALRARGQFRVLYSPWSDADEHFAAVSRLVLAVRDVVFAVDEIWQFQKTAWSPRDLKTMMLQGRHYGVSLIWTAQRPQLTDATLRSVSTELYIGSMPSELDRAAFHGMVEPDALEVAARLPARKFVHRMENLSWRVEA